MILLLVNNAVEESLESLGPYIRTLNHTDFKIHVNALRAAKVPVVTAEVLVYAKVQTIAKLQVTDKARVLSNR